MISLKLDVKKIGAEVKTSKSGEDFVIIPLDKLEVGPNGCILEATLVETRNPQYESTHGIALSKNKDKDAETVFLGNARDFDMEIKPVQSAVTQNPDGSLDVTEYDNDYETGDDLPF